MLFFKKGLDIGPILPYIADNIVSAQIIFAEKISANINFPQINHNVYPMVETYALNAAET